MFLDYQKLSNQQLVELLKKLNESKEHEFQDVFGQFFENISSTQNINFYEETIQLRNNRELILSTLNKHCPPIEFSSEQLIYNFEIMALQQNLWVDGGSSSLPSW
jgi:hypothetical protein